MDFGFIRHGFESNSFLEKENTGKKREKENFLFCVAKRIMSVLNLLNFSKVEMKRLILVNQVVMYIRVLKRFL